MKIMISGDSSFTGKITSRLGFTARKILALSIERGKHWLSIPGNKEKVKAEDRLVVYGPLEALRAISYEN